jgi:hypothetical protein
MRLKSVRELGRGGFTETLILWMIRVLNPPVQVAGLFNPYPFDQQRPGHALIAAGFNQFANIEINSDPAFTPAQIIE